MTHVFICIYSTEGSKKKKKKIEATMKHIGKIETVFCYSTAVDEMRLVTLINSYRRIPFV